MKWIKSKTKETLTVKPFMSGHKGSPQLVTRIVRQILKVLLAPLAEFVFHLLGATRVSLRADSKVLTCREKKTHTQKNYISALSLTANRTG